MPLYKCHKTVRALKITGVTPHMLSGKCADCILKFDHDAIKSKTVSGDYYNKHQPKPGGYYVVYEDGYESFSPAEAFEGGYAPLDGEEGEPVTEEHVEHLASELYDDYCQAVGGKAFNGYPLPKWPEFRADESKQKQSDAWMTVARTALRIPSA